jgi:hypothetical protein
MGLRIAAIRCTSSGVTRVSDHRPERLAGELDALEVVRIRHHDGDAVQAGVDVRLRRRAISDGSPTKACARACSESPATALNFAAAAACVGAM